MRHQLGRNRRTHGPHGALASTVRTAQLAPDGHVTGNTRHHNDASAVGLVLDHLLSRELGSVVDAKDIDAQELLVLLERGVQERDVFVDSCAWHADVQFAAKIGLKRGEAFGQAVHAAHVDSGGRSVWTRTQTRRAEPGEKFGSGLTYL